MTRQHRAVDPATGELLMDKENRPFPFHEERATAGRHITGMSICCLLGGEEWKLRANPGVRVT